MLYKVSENFKPNKLCQWCKAFVTPIKEKDSEFGCVSHTSLAFFTGFREHRKTLVNSILEYASFAYFHKPDIYKLIDELASNVPAYEKAIVTTEAKRRMWRFDLAGYEAGGPCFKEKLTEVVKDYPIEPISKNDLINIVIKLGMDY